MSHIFISYSRKDKRVVGQYVESLRKQDFVVWQDVSNISAGTQWEQALMDAVEQSAAVLVFWSGAASHSNAVNAEIDQAIKHQKLIIPVWLDQNTPLGKLGSYNAVIAGGFSTGAMQKIVAELLEKAPRIQRVVSGFNTTLPMQAQTITGITRELIGSREYLIVPLVTSVYSNAWVIAEAGTIVRQASRIQLIVQNTGTVDYTTVRAAFQTILHEDREYPDEAEPLVGLYVTGLINPSDRTQYRIDTTNVAHYTDMVDTLRQAIHQIQKQAETTQTFQLFLKTLVDIAFLLGVQMDRWLPLQLYKWDGQQYVSVMNIPPRIPN